MHNDYVLPNADWSAIVNVAPAWMSKIDSQLYGCLNGDGGGLWNPSSLISIGGAGVRVAGPFTATNVVHVDLDGDISVQPTGRIELQSGATCEFDGGSACNFDDGSTTNFASGSALTIASGCVVNATLDNGSSFTMAAGSTTTQAGVTHVSGPLTFEGTTWPLLNSRTVTRRFPMVLAWGTDSTTHADPTQNNNQQAGFNTLSGIGVDVLANNTDFFRVAIHPDSLQDAATLVSVTVQYLNGSGITAPIHGSIAKRDLSGSETTIGSSTAGVTTPGNQTFTITVGTAIDLSNFEYFLVIQCPLPIGGRATVNAGYNTMTVTDLRV